jgi:acyl-CoA reductase-like NAD-dependent aldehyde dehydrogenase
LKGLYITPFNFTAIAANLPASAAMMGNVVVWVTAKYSQHKSLLKCLRKQVSLMELLVLESQE